MITLGATSLARLAGVHPDLVRVVKRAALLATPAQDFTVLEGVRTHEAMCVNWGKGRTAQECTLLGVPALYALPHEAKVTHLAHPFTSNHARKIDGYGHAVDLAPSPINWSAFARFDALAALMRAAAQQEAVRIIWGGDWVTLRDRPHFELA